MKNLKVKYKLYGLSIILLVTLLLISTLTMFLMARLNDDAIKVSSNWLPSVIIAEELNTATSDFRIIESSHVISKDMMTMEAHEQTLTAISTEIRTMFNEYSTYLITNEIDQQLLTEAMALWDEYLIIHHDMIKYSRENNTLAAMDIMEGESEDIFNEVSNTFLQLVQFNKQGADEANLYANTIYYKTVFIIGTVMLITIIIAPICSALIIKSVINPVSEIEQAASEILKGELSTEIRYTSKDELGNLSNSMRDLCSMIQNVIADLSNLLEGMAEGDFSVKSEKPELYIGDFSPLLTLTNDISDKLSESIFQLHHQDSLTGLYNRAGFSIKVGKIMENPPKSMGVISMNINGLKHINETSGITAGDTHIKTSADTLVQHLDYKFFRMSGDEFIGLALDIDKASFENKITELHTFMRRTNNYSFSLGHAWGSGHYDLWKLMQEADTIMYINKQEYYASNQRDSDSVDDSILADLLSYLENDEFMIYLQPQVHLKDSSLYGAEALIRRFDKTNQKMVFPDQFIALYEQKSVIRHVDIFVVKAVCKLLHQLNQKGKAIPISVNLSRVTLLEHGIVETIVSICDKYNIPHHLLVIEVTERVGLIENNVASNLITSFKTHGFNISLDDFGCAYSNIITLAQIEVDEIKIDKSLVDDLTTSKKNHILVKNILSMCNELENTSTLAEGIEDEQQAKVLYDLGCHLGQGYYYSRPIPTDEFIEKYINL